MICDLFADVLPFLGKATTATDSEVGMVNSLLPTVEQAVKGFVGTSIESASYTHYLPMVDRGGQYTQLLGSWDAKSGRAWQERAASPKQTEWLVLPEVPVTTVSTIHEDTDAYGGQQSGDFPTSTLLTAGDDYWLHQWESGLCKSGIVVRRGGPWPSRPGTIRVAYTAGWTAAQLTTGIASPIKLACLLFLQRIFGRWGEEAGPIKSERIGDYAVTYAVAEVAKGLPSECKSLLKPFIHIGARL